MSRRREMIGRVRGSVRFRALGDIGEFVRGHGLQKKDFSETGVGCIHYGQIHTHFGAWATDTITFVRPALARRLRHAQSGDLVVATTSEDDEAVGKAVAWLGDHPVAVSGDALIYRHSLDPKFVSYFFQSEQFRSQKTPYITGTKVRRLSGSSLAKVRIPVPPRETQCAIVEVLDSFRELEAQLEAELEAELERRRQQYRYYRDALLSFGEPTDGKASAVPWRTVAEAGRLYGGLTGKSKADFQSGGERFVSYVNVFKNVRTMVEPEDCVRIDVGESQNRVRYGDMLFTASSETAEDVGMSSVVTVEPKQPLYLNSFCFGLRLNDPDALLPEFAKHLFRSRLMREQIVRTANGVTRFNVSKDRFRQIHVPFPPVAEQQQIASTLDHLDTLVNDLTIALPAELRARRTQYEYYRERLLTFRETA